MIQTTTLDNGLRIVVDHRPGQIIYCGLAVEAGTRHELDTESGMAHFTEHMSFKGTTRRRAWHIINRMESVGGELNAYTGKEHTIYYCSTLHKHLLRAIDLLFDITLNSTYPQHEMDKEAEVVIDEIESYNDSPSELIYDDFEAFIFPNNPLGRNILGNAERLREYHTEDMLRFTRRLYHPNRMVLFVLGDTTLNQVANIAKRTCKSENHETAPIKCEVPNIQPSNQNSIIRKSTHQAHVIVGAQAFGMTDERHMALYFLNNILGGPGMNSRLNLALRERRGLVYTVESSLTTYSDTGVWTTYFGCDHADVNRCLRLVHNELSRLTDSALSPSALRVAKQQLQGQAALSWENGENVAINMGRRFLHTSNTLTLSQFCEAVETLTAQQLLDVAQLVFSPDRLLTFSYQ